MRDRAADWASRPFGMFRDPELGRRGRWILFSALIGLVSGIGAILFDLVFRFAQWGLLQKVGGFLPPGTGSEGGPGFPPQHPWLLPLSLVIGGLLSGALVFRLAPEAEGHGTDAVIKAFHHLRGKIRRRVPGVKALASAITIGSGGSGGREGPIAQIGAGFGSFVADAARFGDADRRVLMLAGVAGGVGSIFRAPLGAALFSAEVLYSEPEFEYNALLPGLISAIIGYSVYSSYAGWGFLFDVPAISFHSPSHLLVYALLGVLCGLLGYIYPPIFYGVRDRIFQPLRLPKWLKPAVGALVVGLIGVYFPAALGMGYGYIQQAIDGRLTIGFLLTFMFAKIVATSFTISSGGSGGVFGPSLVIGGALGAAFGQAAVHLMPAFAPDPVACIMVGMSGFFAGVAKVPFASVIMVMEMTGSYGLLVPALLVGAAAYLFLPIKVSLYENQVPTRADSPAHQESLAADYLRRFRIRDVWTPGPTPLCTISQDTPLSGVLDRISSSNQDLFPVLNGKGKLVGEISLDDLREALLSDAPRELLVAWDLMRAVTGPVEVGDDLATASRLLADRETRTLIVVKREDGLTPVGLFSRRDLIAAYGRQVHESGAPEETPLLT